MLCHARKQSTSHERKHMRSEITHPVRLLFGVISFRDITNRYTSMLIKGNIAHQIAIILTISFGSFSPYMSLAEDLPAGYENAPITAEAVELNGYISTIVYPGGGQFIVGEAGAVFPQLETNTAPSKIVTVLGGRVNGQGNVDWNIYLDNFYARVYSANTTTGYLGGANYISEFKLGRPVDTNNKEFTTVLDGVQVLPNLPTFAIIHPTNTNPLENQGYLLGFNLTTDSNAVNATTALIPQNVLDLMQNDPDGYVLTFHVKSDLGAGGGVRIAIQDAGFGQGQLKQATFHSNSQGRTYGGDPNQVSYAIGLEIDGCLDDADKLSPGICGCGIADTDTDNDGIIDCEEIWLIPDAQGNWLTVTNTIPGRTNWLESTPDLTGNWSTLTTWMATSTLTNLPVSPTNDSEYFRVKFIR